MCLFFRCDVHLSFDRDLTPYPCFCRLDPANAVTTACRYWAPGLCCSCRSTKRWKANWWKNRSWRYWLPRWSPPTIRLVLRLHIIIIITQCNAITTVIYCKSMFTGIYLVFEIFFYKSDVCSTIVPYSKNNYLFDGYDSKYSIWTVRNAVYPSC